MTLILRTRADVLAVLDRLHAHAILSTRITTIKVNNARTAIAQRIEAALFVDLLGRCPALRTLHLLEWGFSTFSASDIQRLAAACACMLLHGLYIGPAGFLETQAFFLLLSITPNLQVLEMGRVCSTGESDSSPLPAPACSLTSLRIVDDWDIDHGNYPLLLCKSHETLSELCLDWIIHPEIVIFVAGAISACTAVRKLTLLGEVDFDDLIAACPRARSVTLAQAPTEAGTAALKPHIRELVIAHCIAPPDDFGLDFFAYNLPALRDLLPRLPSLRTLAVVPNVLRGAGSYFTLRTLCVERRVLVSTTLPDLDDLLQHRSRSHLYGAQKSTYMAYSPGFGFPCSLL
ncbi:hypothetical protein AURDEDRAFT_162601 [Auricularia subglabra TFB-10046 SS5]|nr:hypothetical protein AURDEDRAFT_162601 [Auricularia subglabra TFB-10046 SS5]